MVADDAHAKWDARPRASELVAWRLLEPTEERSYRIGLPLRIIASEYCESEVCSTTQTVMRALVPYSAWLARLRLILVAEIAR